MKKIIPLLFIFVYSLNTYSQGKSNKLTIEFIITNYSDTNDIQLSGKIVQRKFANLWNDIEKTYAVVNGKCTVSVTVGTSCSYSFKYKCYNGYFTYALVVNTAGAAGKDYFQTLHIEIPGKENITRCLSWNSKIGRFIEKDGVPDIYGAVFCKEKQSAPEIIDIKAKLLRRESTNKQFLLVKNQTIFLQDSTKTTIRSAKTNSFGDFVFKGIDSRKSYDIVLGDSKNTRTAGELFIAKTNGVVVSKMTKDIMTNEFHYILLSPEICRLSVIPADDPNMLIKNFEKPEVNEVIYVQNIQYPSNGWNISEAEEKKLEKIITLLNQHINLQLEIASYTDSKGDDDYNMRLSQKRAQAVAEYLIAKGITASRIIAKGYGETSILNGCVNDTDCSEKEHELNRRTEFRFSKK